MKTTKNYCKLNGISHQCQFYSEDRVCLNPDGPDVECEFAKDRNGAGKKCDELFSDTGMCRSTEAQNDAAKTVP